jgi:hypothetical protein
MKDQLNARGYRRLPEAWRIEVDEAEPLTIRNTVQDRFRVA